MSKYNKAVGQDMDNPYVQHQSGNRIYLKDMTNNTYNIKDIAHSLSHAPRFNGHTDTFYSVAQHSWYASQMATKDEALEALMHDCGESVLTDIPRPVKYFIPGVKEFDDKISMDMFAKFGLRWPLTQSIKLIDDRLLSTEARQLLKNVDIKEWGYLGTLESFNFTITPWRPEFAKEQFISRYNYLWEQRVMHQDGLVDDGEVIHATGV